MNEDSIIAATVSAVVGLVVALIAHRRAKAAIRRESIRERDAAANEQVKVITKAYEDVLDQLRIEIDRLVKARLQDRVRWELREEEMAAKIKELEGKLFTEVDERVRLQRRVEELERCLSSDNVKEEGRE